jgi:hypothetical protein
MGKGKEGDSSSSGQGSSSQGGIRSSVVSSSLKNLSDSQLATQVAIDADSYTYY